ncbi:CHASE3 domain-containing protein [Chryseolinea sp. T2]|uniref:CHASE3 domain-containing protein n=1 Tax=Chryseolinea sp. T2 TaxID=3129255 RepID=UPI003077BA59
MVRNFLTRHGAKVALAIVIALILADTAITYSYKSAMSSNTATQHKLTEIAARKGTIISDLNNIDMSLRGYLLVGNEAFVGTYDKIKHQNRPTMSYLEGALPEIGLEASILRDMEAMMNKYFELMDKAISLYRNGNAPDALTIIKEDHGTAVWQTYVKLSEKIDPVIQNLQNESELEYSRLLTLSMFFQGVLFILGVPTLIYAIRNLQRTQKRRVTLFEKLDRQNRTLIFDSNEPVDIEDEDAVITGMIDNLKKSEEFIKSIAQGDLEVKWDGFSKANAAINNNNISGALLVMRDGMKQRQADALRQQWVSEGLNKLADVIRDNQTNFVVLCEKTVSFIVKYLNAQQGSLFVLNSEQPEDPHLSLMSCYAFDKKKHVTKRVDIGEGMLGQVYLEGQPSYITAVPENYVHITSGLGEARPRSLTIYPFKHNDIVVALIEIASFTALDSYALDFLGDAGKSISASISTIQTNARTQTLLEMSQQQMEQLRSQEEEMRQNMEELEATQEEMRRRENGQQASAA